MLVPYVAPDFLPTFFIFEIGNCDRPTKEYGENRAEPLEGISKFHSIWISHGGELRGQELSCGTCTISDRCVPSVQCEETVTKNLSAHFVPKCMYTKKTFDKHISTHQ